MVRLLWKTVWQFLIKLNTYSPYNPVILPQVLTQGFPGSSAGKESAYNARDPSLFPGSGRSPGEGIEYPLQCSISLQCERPRFRPWIAKIPWRRAWQSITVFLPGESPWTEEPGGLQSMGSQRVKHSWSDGAHRHEAWEAGIFIWAVLSVTSSSHHRSLQCYRVCWTIWSKWQGPLFCKLDPLQIPLKAESILGHLMYRQEQNCQTWNMMFPNSSSLPSIMLAFLWWELWDAIICPLLWSWYDY